MMTVKQQGRSAVIRRAVLSSQRRRSTIAEAYRRGYGKRPAESDLNGWANEGVGLGIKVLLNSAITSPHSQLIAFILSPCPSPAREKESTVLRKISRGHAAGVCQVCCRCTYPLQRSVRR